MTQEILDAFILKMKKEKYRNKIQDLKLEYIDNEKDNKPYIYLALIKIKKSQRNKGIGNALMSDIVQLADEHNVQINLLPTNLYGAELDRLYSFYNRHGFVLIKKKNKYEDIMEYYPKKTILK